MTTPVLSTLFNTEDSAIWTRALRDNLSTTVAKAVRDIPQSAALMSDESLILCGQ